MPQRLTCGGIQRHQIVARITRKHQVARGAQQPTLNSRRLPLMAPLDLSSAVVESLQHRLIPGAQIMATPSFRLVAIVKNVIDGKGTSGVEIEQYGGGT